MYLTALKYYPSLLCHNIDVTRRQCANRRDSKSPAITSAIVGHCSLSRLYSQTESSTAATIFVTVVRSLPVNLA